MSAISKEDVLNLREKTGAGLIDCKRALVERKEKLNKKNKTPNRIAGE